MIEKYYFELMNRDIDGSATAEEQKSLRSYMADHVEARDYYNELVRVAAELQKVRYMVAPAGLKSAVMASLPPVRPAAQRTVPRLVAFFESLREWMVLKPSFSLAAGALAGATVMMVVFYMYGMIGMRDTDSLRGTMMPPESEVGMQEVANVSISAGQSIVSVATARDGNRVVCKIQAKAPVAGTVRISFDQSDLSLAGVLKDYGEISDLSISDGQVSAKLWDQGAVRLVFHDLSPVRSDLQVSITQQGATVARQVSTGGAK